MTMYLYRKWRQAVTLAAAMVALSSALGAQWGAPLPERKTPRAVAVLEIDENGNRRLIPVTFFYERHYYDATFYRATPVPFTLSSQTVYEVQQFGKPLGTFTVQSATREQSVWWGNGHFKTAPDAATLARKKAVRPVVLEDPSRPVLHRREGSEGDHPAAATSQAPEVEDDPDRPTLHRSPGSDSSSDGTASTSAQAGAPQLNAGQDADRPVLHRKDDAGDGKPAAPASTANQSGNGSGGSAVSSASARSGATAEPASNEEAVRPILRRGKPAEEQGGRGLPEFHQETSLEHKPGATDPKSASATGGLSRSSTYLPSDGGPVTRQVAVSDAGTSEPQELIFACPQEQRQQMEGSARELAQAELRRVAAMRGLTLPEASANAAAEKGKPRARSKSGSISKPGTSAEASPPPALTLEAEQFVPYDLDYNNYATVVYSARYRPATPGAGAGNASLPAAGAGGNASLPAAGVNSESWVVTVIARQDGDKLVRLYGAVSDPRELDLYPEVRLVDAVDPDGYGRYALLFREQKRDGVSWLLGRVTGYELQTLFETAAR
jgi:hypothetical protein